MGKGQVTNSQINGLEPVLHKECEDMKEKQVRVGYDPNDDFQEKYVSYVNKTGKLAYIIHLHGERSK